MPAITIRNVPDSVRNVHAARAAAHGQSLQEYLHAKLVAEAERPTQAEVMARIRARTAATGTHTDAEAILADLHADRR